MRRRTGTTTRPGPPRRRLRTRRGMRSRWPRRFTRGQRIRHRRSSTKTRVSGRRAPIWLVGDPYGLHPAPSCTATLAIWSRLNRYLLTISSRPRLHIHKPNQSPKFAISRLEIWNPSQAQAVKHTELLTTRRVHKAKTVTAKERAIFDRHIYLPVPWDGWRFPRDIRRRWVTGEPPKQQLTNQKPRTEKPATANRPTHQRPRRSQRARRGRDRGMEWTVQRPRTPRTERRAGRARRWMGLYRAGQHDSIRLLIYKQIIMRLGRSHLNTRNPGLIRPIKNSPINGDYLGDQSIRFAILPHHHTELGLFCRRFVRVKLDIPAAHQKVEYRP